MTTEFVPPKVPVGWPVCHYAHALPGEAPQAAIVLGTGVGGTVQLGVFDAKGPARVVRSVRHLDDPYLKTCDRQVRMRHGAWDFAGGVRYEDLVELIALVPRLRKLVDEPPRAGTPLDQDDTHRTILAMAAKGHSNREIADALGGEWTVAKVMDALRDLQQGERPGRKDSRAVRPEPRKSAAAL